MLWCCAWGPGHAALVRDFLAQLRSPDVEADDDPQDPGTPWLELAVSYILWSGRRLPIKPKGDKDGQALEFLDARVQLLPNRERWWGAVSESFRWIVHLLTFGKAHYIPHIPNPVQKAGSFLALSPRPPMALRADRHITQIFFFKNSPPICLNVRGLVYQMCRIRKVLHSSGMFVMPSLGTRISTISRIRTRVHELSPWPGGHRNCELVFTQLPKHVVAVRSHGRSSLFVYSV